MRNPFIAVSRFLYLRILPCYPPALRAEFGAEMAEVFVEDIAAAWQRASWRGAARAWSGVSRDLAGIALPYLVVRATPVLLAVLSSIVLYGSLLAAIDPNRHCHK